MRVNFGNISNIGDKVIMTGASSGLDTKSIIDATVKAKEIPINKLKDTIDIDNKKIAAYNNLNNLITAFKNSANILRNPQQYDKSDDIFSKKQINITSNNAVSGNSFIGVAAANLSDVGNYNITNLTLATPKSQSAQNFISNTASVTSSTDTQNQFTSGTFQINGTDITINDGDSLIDIQSNINSVASLTNVKANIIQIASNNFQFTLESTIDGVANSYNIDDPNNCLSNISWNVISAVDSSFNFNNIPMTRSTNNVNDIIDGITFNFYQSMPNNVIVNIDVNHSPADVEGAIVTFVGCYNDIKTFIANQNQRDSTTNKYIDDAVLGGDQLLRNIDQNIEDEIMKIVNGINSSPSNFHPINLAEIGISFYDSTETSNNIAVSNLLQIDNNKLATMLTNNFTDVKNIFGFNSYSSNNNFFITQTSSQFGTTKFSLDLNLSRQIGQQAVITYIDNNNNTVSINANFANTSNNGSSGVISLAKNGAVSGNNIIPTLLDGIKISYIGSNNIATTNINFTQGIADRIYDITNNMIDSGQGIINSSINDINSDINNKGEKISKLESQLKETKDRLLKQFASVEKAISEANSILQMLEANDYAKRDK